jgi:hypothetical protein
MTVQPHGSGACVGEPISWLRLERYRLQELAPDQRGEIEQHLHACDACRACLAHVGKELVLPPLPARETRVTGRAWSRAQVRWIAAGGALAAAAATVLLVLRPASPGLEPPQRTLTIKGGELAIGVVRERAGSIAHEPVSFAPGDRFKVVLTCPPDMRPHVDVVVFQAGEAFFPLPHTRLAQCGNAVALPGAFALDGAAEALVCAVISQSELPRAALAARGVAGLPKTSVCHALVPAPARP